MPGWGHLAQGCLDVWLHTCGYKLVHGWGGYPTPGQLHYPNQIHHFIVQYHSWQPGAMLWSFLPAELRPRHPMLQQKCKGASLSKVNAFSQCFISTHLSEIRTVCHPVCEADWNHNDAWAFWPAGLSIEHTHTRTRRHTNSHTHTHTHTHTHIQTHRHTPVHTQNTLLGCTQRK